MNIMIIGGTGILSMEVCKAAVKKGYNVTCINRGNNKELDIANSKTIIADIRNPQDVKKKIEDIEVDVLIDFLSYNVEQMKCMLEMFKGKFKQYIFISSATVYLKKDENEIIEEDVTEIGNPLWQYAINKTKCEQYLGTLNDVKYTIVRPYVTYGKNRIPFAVISEGNYWALANRILLGKPIIMWDKGEAICTLTHSSDFAEGMMGLLMNENAYGQAFHITSNEHLQWKDVLAGIEKALGVSANVIYMPSQYIEDNMAMYKGALLGDKATNMRFSDQKMKRIVPNFECKVKFEDGIADTIKFYKENKFMRKVDYKWDGLMDCMIAKYCKENKISYEKKLLKCLNFEEKPSKINRLKYEIARRKWLYAPSNAIYMSIKKLKKKMKR